MEREAISERRILREKLLEAHDEGIGGRAVIPYREGSQE